MIKSKIFNNKKDIKKVISGIKKNAEIVSKTYGYSGHDIGIRFSDHTAFTNDGVFVSNHIFFEDELEDMGSDIIRKATANADLSSNDGTTSTAIITKSIISDLEKKVLNKKNIDINSFRKGMNEAKNDIIKKLEESKKDIKIDSYKSLFNIAFTSTRDDYLSDLLANVFLEIGRDGKVLFREFEGSQPEVEYKEGFVLQYGYNTNMLPNVLKDSAICIYNERLNSAEIFKGIINKAISLGHKSLCIFVRDGAADLVMQQAIAIQQSPQINIDINIIKIQGSVSKVDDEIKDLAIITNAKILDNSSFNPKADDYFGEATNISITNKETTIIDGNSNEEKYNEHLLELEKDFENNRNNGDREKIQKRIANLKGKVAIIKIGGLSRERISNNVDKIKDSVGSIKNAIDNGIVNGGGIALLDVYKTLENKKSYNKSYNLGYNMVLKATLNPFKMIIKNSSENKKVFNKIIKDSKLGIGYDARSRDISENMIKDGIVDPFNTIVNSIKTAVDTCSLFLNLDTIITVRSGVMEDE